MVIFWSIKSGIDLAAYGMGMTDKFKGTGVFNAIEFEREPKNTEAAPADSKAAATKTGEVQKETVPK